MSLVYSRKQARYRVQVRDMKTGKARGFSLYERKNLDLDDLKQELLLYFMNKEKQ